MRVIQPYHRGVLSAAAAPDRADSSSPPVLAPTAGRSPGTTDPRIEVPTPTVDGRPVPPGPPELVPRVPRAPRVLSDRHRDPAGTAGRTRRPAGGRIAGSAAGTADGGATARHCGRRWPRRGRARWRTWPVPGSGGGRGRAAGIRPGRGLRRP